MSYFFLDEYKNMESYIPGEQPHDRKYIKLNANESSFPPSPKVREAMSGSEIDSMAHYSDPHCMELREAIGREFGFPAEQVFVGNGADEVLGFCMMSFFKPGMKVCFPDITYDFYRTYSTTYRLDFEQIPLRDDFTVDTDKFVEANRDVILANPNNPTGLAIPVAEIERILKRDPRRMVIIDEAYVDYGNESCLSLVPKYSNLVVIQTFSKSRNMPGARIGFAISQKDIISDMNKIKFAFNPFNMSSLAIAGGKAAIEDVNYFHKCVTEVARVRDEFEKNLLELHFEVIPTTTNFVFFKPVGVNGKEMTEELKKRGILVRHYEDERIKEYVRITVGREEEMKTVLAAIKEILADAKISKIAPDKAESKLA